jgi:hypothetical protein
MKKVLLLSTLAGFLLLGGCAGTGVTPAAIQSAVDTFRQGVVSTCGFLLREDATIHSASDILATFIPSASSIEAAVAAAVKSVCAAVAPVAPKVAGRLKAATPTVNGVLVHGRFVR